MSEELCTLRWHFEGIFTPWGQRTNDMVVHEIAVVANTPETDAEALLKHRNACRGLVYQRSEQNVVSIHGAFPPL